MAPSAEPSPTPQPKRRFYKVKAGDTLTGIDRNYLENESVFTTLIRLRDALGVNDLPAIERAASSIDTDNQRRDDHLRSADFFDAGKHRLQLALIGDIALEQQPPRLVLRQLLQLTL